MLGAATAAPPRPRGAALRDADACADLRHALGRRQAQAGTKGGTIVVTGEHIEVAGATIDASGRDGGGKVLIGGDWGGGKPDKSLVHEPERASSRAIAIPTATTVSVDAATQDRCVGEGARRRRQGGAVGGRPTSFAGTILALGGREFGNGGFAEVSGKGAAELHRHRGPARAERQRRHAAARSS